MICKIQDTGLEHSKQQNGPDIIDTCYLLSIKKGEGLAVVFIPYSQSQNCYLLALLASVSSMLKCSGFGVLSFSFRTIC